MQPPSVVVYQNNQATAQVLAAGLAQHFAFVYLASDGGEVSASIARHRANAVVLDLEKSGPGEVQRLRQEFPDLYIVGTHRLADDKLWTEAITLGAADICEPRNPDVLRSLEKGLAKHAAA